MAEGDVETPKAVLFFEIGAPGNSGTPRWADFAGPTSRVTLWPGNRRSGLTIGGAKPSVDIAKIERVRSAATAGPTIHPETGARRKAGGRRGKGRANTRQRAGATIAGDPQARSGLVGAGAVKEARDIGRSPRWPA